MGSLIKDRKAKCLIGFALVFAAMSGGCRTTAENTYVPELPMELNKVNHPAYMLEPPDILQLDLITAIPKAPYRIRTLDVIGVVIQNTLPGSFASGSLTVSPDGTIDLGQPYGSIAVANLTLDEAKALVEKELSKHVKQPTVSFTLVQGRAIQQVRGPHLIKADGTVGLGAFGSVPVAGMTLPQAKLAIETHLKKYFQEPEISLEIIGYNSKIYYVVFDYGGSGQQVVRLPITGNETVLDAISQVNGLPTVADQKRIVLARPGPALCPPQRFPIDWKAIVNDGDIRTNYQIMPGDRIIVKAYPLVQADVFLARVIAPIERVLGVTLLGAETYGAIKYPQGSSSGAP
jgi:polysaccharide biosynthesis/export protein